MSEVFEASLELVNTNGLHARPCHAIVSLALAHDAALQVAAAGSPVNGKSILELMTLSAPCGTQLHFRAEGPQAASLIRAIQALVDSGFGERD